ncbi:MAG: trypsin-like peptidase domain-containing protein, partial [Oscillospiraceae bacterium]|nr:trypsin-like peptidase domain-containing protein [Oscillospiraceae bacterium]
VNGLTPAQLGDSDQVQLGETVCALGNPAGLSGSITTGIISGVNRMVRAKSTNFEMECFQTDAAISPGNSGGALVNLYGQVIGITSSKYGSSAMFGSTYEGLGFAITINDAVPIIQELMEQGYVSGRVRIGIQFLDNLNAHSTAEANGKKLPESLNGIGIQIVSISDDSDLRNTELKSGDWLLTMNGKEIVDYDTVNRALEGLEADDVVHCRCARVREDGTLKTFEIDFRLLEDQSGEF